jgi:hypothetical protein
MCGAYYCDAMLSVEENEGLNICDDFLFYKQA